ncbi:MAG TPA: hypothetical protein VJB70_04290 [Candidatus Paceibacterota bacterium]
MFFVLTTPNGKGATVTPCPFNETAPRLMIDDPSSALIAARQARSDGFSEFVSAIKIYELEFGQIYGPNDFNGMRVQRLVYSSERDLVHNNWSETFYGSMEIMRQFAQTLAHVG